MRPTRPSRAGPQAGRAHALSWRPGLAAAVAMLAFVVAAFRLDRRPYWIDEAYNVILVRDGWASFLKTIGNQEPSQALYLIFLKPWIGAVGEGEWIVRLPSVLGAAAACAALVYLGTRLFDRTTGVLAGVFLATDAGVVQWAQFARTYAWAVLATVATTAIFVRALRDDKPAWWVLYGAAGAVSIYCHFYAGFVLVAHALAYCAAPERAAPRRLLLGWLVLAVGLIPVGGYFVAGTRSTVAWIPAPSADRAWRAVELASGANVALLAAAGVGAVSLVVGLPRASRWKVVLVGGWVVCPLVCGLVVSLFEPAFVERFLLVTAPALTLLAAVGVLAFNMPAVRALAVVAILAISAVRLLNVYSKSTEDWRSAGAAARQASARGDAVAVAPAFGWRMFELYARDVPRTDRPDGRRLALFVLKDRRNATRVARAFVGSGYTLAGSEEFGSQLILQVWAPRASTSR